MGNLEALNRKVLKMVILPEFASSPGVRRVLFVGCAQYTRDYEEHFAGHDYYTIDIDPAAAAYGASKPGRHFVDSVEYLGRYLQPSFLHAILLNGVFGYGLDDPQRAETTVATCHDLLMERGALMIGWNDLPECKPFEPLSLAALGRFDRVEFPALRAVPGVRRLGRGDYLVNDDYQHVFSFFEKRDL